MERYIHGCFQGQHEGRLTAILHSKFRNILLGGLNGVIWKSCVKNRLVANHRLLHLTAIQTMHQYPLIHRLAACVTRAMKFLEVV